MILKSADDKSKRLALLQDLQNSPVLDPKQKRWLREELVRLRQGIKGEQESAYFLEQYFKGGENHVLLHDLRITFDGDVAQIDHLIFNRGVGVYLIETKNYSGNVIINDHGEFTVEYEDGERIGVQSPIEQSQRHARILQRLMERLEIRNRTGGPLDCYHVVMFHPNGGDHPSEEIGVRHLQRDQGRPVPDLAPTVHRQGVRCHQDVSAGCEHPVPGYLEGMGREVDPAAPAGQPAGTSAVHASEARSSSGRPRAEER